jgi:hypothetical protein
MIEIIDNPDTYEQMTSPRLLNTHIRLEYLPKQILEKVKKKKIGIIKDLLIFKSNLIVFYNIFLLHFYSLMSWPLIHVHVLYLTSSPNYYKVYFCPVGLVPTHLVHSSLIKCRPGTQFANILIFYF